MKQPPFSSPDLKETGGIPGLTPRFVSEALGLPAPSQRASSDQDAPFTAVTTDSRKILTGSLFVAIPGEKFDGHDFALAAIEKGARGVMVRRGFSIPSPGNAWVYEVENTLTGYRRLASAWRGRFKIPVVVVAGSVGKTTTKELLTSLLSGKWEKVLKTQGSQNGFVGIPMTLLELRAPHSAAVIEVGIDDIGTMKGHLELIHPSASILTAIGPEHLEHLRDVPTVAREEGLALETVASTGGLVIINRDDPWIEPYWSRLASARKVGFSLGKLSPAPDSLSGQIQGDGTQLQVQGLGPSAESFSLPLPGAHNARNLLGALAMAKGLGLTPSEMKKGLATFQGAEGRSQIRTLPGDTLVLCDYYNASPDSMPAGIEVLKELAAPKSRPTWACLADMLELGPGEEKFHRDLAPKLKGVQHVLLYGKRMRALYEELKATGFSGDLEHFSDQAALSRRLLAGLAQGDAVLLKGSHSMKMEVVWKDLSDHAATHWKSR